MEEGPPKVESWAVWPIKLLVKTAVWALPVVIKVAIFSWAHPLLTGLGFFAGAFLQDLVPPRRTRFSNFLLSFYLYISILLGLLLFVLSHAIWEFAPK
jgi:hypothetical protein